MLAPMLMATKLKALVKTQYACAEMEITSGTCCTVSDLSYDRGVQRHLLETCIVDFCERITRRMLLIMGAS